MRCTRCGPDWAPGIADCPICGRRLTTGEAADRPAHGEPPAPDAEAPARLDLSRFDPWADDPDGPGLPLEAEPSDEAPAAESAS